MSTLLISFVVLFPVRVTSEGCMLLCLLMLALLGFILALVRDNRVMKSYSTVVQEVGDDEDEDDEYDDEDEE